MKFNKKIVAIAVMTIGIYSVYHIQKVEACLITLTNDLEKAVQIESKGKGQEAFVLQPNETREFGDKHEHADFYLNIKSKKGNFKKKYEVMQTVCPSHLSATKFNVSAIIENTLDDRFFKVDKINGNQSDNIKHDMYDHEDMNN